MSLSDQEQQRVWIIAQKVMFESPNFDKQLSNMQILCKVFSIGFNIDEIKDSDDESEMIAVDSIKMIDKIKELRTHEIIRKQKAIQLIKFDIDNLISRMIHTIDPRNMVDFPIYET